MATTNRIGANSIQEFLLEARDVELIATSHYQRPISAGYRDAET